MNSVADPRLGLAVRPLAEGANIRTWIGFKHFMYLAEQAVLDWFRDRGYGPSVLFHDHGLGLAVRESAVALPAVLDVDDLVASEVTGGPGRFTVRLAARRPGEPAVLRGHLSVALVRESAGLAPVPAELSALVVTDLAQAARPVRDSGGGLDGGTPFSYSWRIPYYYCQYSRRIAHSGYVRAMEEAVDRFLEDRGLSVGTLLRERSWIPVVSRARVTVLADAFMEETVRTVVTVTDVLRQVSFAAKVDHFVHRDGAVLPVATGTIVHAYAIAGGPGTGGLAQLDEAVIAALAGGQRP